MAFLHGLGEHELSDADYDVTDPYNPMLVGVRARKLPPQAGSSRKRNHVAALRRKSDVRGLVLLYHRIEAVAHDPFDLTVAPELFAAHLEVIAGRGTIVDLHHLLTAPPEDLPERAIALTFDDGYAAHLTDLLPMLERSSSPATFFVTSAGLERDVEYWWDTLERVNPATMRVLHDQSVHASLTDRAALVAPYAGSGTPLRRPLRAEELRRLAAGRGVTIGAHTVHHLLLTAQPDEVRRREMTECRSALEALTGTPVTLFAYPYGAVDEATARLAREQFDYALDCTPSAVTRSFDAARVPRVDVKQWTRDELGARLDALFAPATRDARLSFLP
jgi:peptidoglycan/xylan/chitin deacetylase (PgdA/CDA1 family)